MHPARRPATFSRALQVLGAAGCLVLVAALPWQAVLAGCAVFLAGIRLPPRPRSNNRTARTPVTG